jgi:hypothetical protein
MGYNMLDGAVGDATQITAEFVNASQASDLTYPTRILAADAGRSFEHH